MKTILITGASGFIGVELQKEMVLLDQVRLITCDRNPAQIGNPIQHICGDINSQATLSSIKHEINTIVHLAADVDVGSLSSAWKDNICATFKLVRWARQHGVKRMVYLSSAAVYKISYSGEKINEKSRVYPLSAYAWSKWIGEKIARLWMRETFILRLPYLYGKGDSHGSLSQLLRKVRNREPVTVRDESRDYLHVSDVVRAIRKTISYKGNKRLFAFGSGESTTMSALLNMMGNACDEEPMILIRGHRLNGMVDFSLAKTELGWLPQVSLRSGIASLVRVPEKIDDIAA